MTRRMLGGWMERRMDRELGDRQCLEGWMVECMERRMLGGWLDELGRKEWMNEWMDYG